MDIRTFIRQNGLNLSYRCFSQGVRQFVQEMNDGLSGKDSSLKMIPTFIPDGGVAVKRQRVIALDMGGTNLRVALVCIKESEPPVTEYLEVYPMPGTGEALTKDAFFAALAGYIQPIASTSDRIGLCFSFPCEIQSDLDGRILGFNKEVKIENAEGALLGEELRKALRQKGLAANHRIVVLNDTAATLLGGRAESQGRLFDSYIGFILGTGTNCSYIEANARILKDSRLYEKVGYSLINMESGGYAKAPRNEIDDAFDQTTAQPGTQLLEKMISGAYQGGMLLHYIRMAAAGGCFTGPFCERLSGVMALQSKEIDAFCFYPYGENVLSKLAAEDALDRRALYELIDAFFDRAAVLTVMNLTAIMEQTGTGKDPLKPVCISAEGSTFYKCKLLGEKIRHYMIAFVQKEMGIHAEFLRAENATLSGTALAALSGETRNFE